jgi:hypothetical protein
MGSSGLDRHRRQTRLTEVGAGGQERLAGARVEVRVDGLAAHVAVRYLAGAGVGQLQVRAASLAAAASAVDPGVRVAVEPRLPVEPGEAFDLSDPAARAVAAGAMAALNAVKGALGMLRGRGPEKETWEAS